MQSRIAKSRGINKDVIDGYEYELRLKWLGTCKDFAEGLGTGTSWQRLDATSRQNVNDGCAMCIQYFYVF